MKPDKPKPRLWPRFGVSPTGARAIFHCIGDLPHGWRLETPLPGEPAVEPSPPAPVEPEAPPPPVADLAALREQYKAKFGKRAGPKWDADTIRQKLKTV